MASAAEQSQTFRSPGTYTFTVPADVSRITVVAIGGSGGGGAGGGSKGGNLTGGGGGAGGAGAKVVCDLDVTPKGRLALTVGAGGAGGAAPTGDDDGAAGQPGQASAFGYKTPYKDVDVMAAGGAQGAGGSGSSWIGSGGGGAGGSGGQVTDSWCVWESGTVLSGRDGVDGTGGAINRFGRGGFGRSVTVEGFSGGCNSLLFSGGGGHGAGDNDDSDNDTWQYPAEAGEAGSAGCVSVTYSTGG